MATEPIDAVNILPLARFEPTTSTTPPIMAIFKLSKSIQSLNASPMIARSIYPKDMLHHTASHLGIHCCLLMLIFGMPAINDC